MDNRIWELKTKGGEVLEIPGTHADTVKRRWDAGQPIHTSGGSVDAKMIASFEPTSRQSGQLALQAEAAQVFGEAIATSDTSVEARWVKKAVTTKEFAKHYSNIPAYHPLENNNGMVTIAFKLATHNVDPSNLQYCSQQEVQKLTPTQ